MTTTYDDYRRVLEQIRQLPGRTSAEVNAAQQAQTRALQFADQAVQAADAAAVDASKAIEVQLAAARSALEPLGKANLVPPHLRPSGGIPTATRDDLAQSQTALSAAVNQLRQAVQGEIRRIELENERLAKEAVDRERAAREAASRAAAEAARRKKLIQIGAVAAVVLIIVIVILIFVL